MSVIGLIPARSGSRRVINKNIRVLGNKPLIAYTIEAALKTKTIDRIIVTTDSPKTAEIAKSFGAEVPFLRPRSISRSSSTELEFHLHLLSWLKETGSIDNELIVNLYPTTPFRKSSTIEFAIETIRNNPESDSLRSVKKCQEHPFKMWTRKGKHLVPFVQDKPVSQSTQAYHLLPEVLIQNASIYITKPSTLLKYNNTLGNTILCFEMDDLESFDINTPLDFKIASFLQSQM